MLSTTEHHPRTIVLCFDGTGNKFGEYFRERTESKHTLIFHINSNVVKFCSALVKNQPDKQIVYYQPGIGTYNERQLSTRTISTVFRMVDSCIAINLDVHVKEGYQFIMRNYRYELFERDVILSDIKARPGDKICLFGFSRGAHTARVISGMLYKVGLLLPHNDQQLDFAFAVYKSTGPHGIQLSKDFKKFFSVPVTVEFVGVWDTVSSVGIFPQGHPYTSINYAIKTFRHALALDERRARFRPQTWNEPTVEQEQDLDVDDPLTIMKPRGKTSTNTWVYQPPDRTTADVKEVWFAGAHSDIGGGSHANTEPGSLSFIPLRWMIKECLITGTGILFDADVLSRFEFDFDALERSQGVPTMAQLGFADRVGVKKSSGDAQAGSPTAQTSSLPEPEPSIIFPLLTRLSGIAMPKIKEQYSSSFKLFISHDAFEAFANAYRASDSFSAVYDQLIMKWAWWTLEWLPTFTTYQTPTGEWMQRRMGNFGMGRYIPFSDDYEVLVHRSVKQRIDQEALKYKPAAFNWDMVDDSGMRVWVD
ncbi:hypothetical protein HYPSUDRAFT_76229 [Hypholoma sublateritium FD-334 SS-4]|uniref:T6SS Phospholipase effector Tle1-like catalytic domain-containing protein n=1 Tax=Hypholoma sublateritium (strain FD-334 SS-4) TaxID=945553 RepID=A0A0D2LC96_HYPSF|nr:hypothetical protein HYPSUDRAFT_76229 [Hypholoma sublateritium FD-334 SS-4]